MYKSGGLGESSLFLIMSNISLKLGISYMGVLNIEVSKKLIVLYD